MTRVRAAPLAVVLYAGLVAVSIWNAGVPLTHEDGFYYFAIARHLAAGAGSTFDGLHPTNGYHPLWLLVLSAVHAAAPAGRALIYGTALQGALWVASAVGLLVVARKLVGAMPAFLAVLVWVGLTDRIALAGLEWTLHALLVVAGAWAWQRRGRTPRQALSLGILLSFTALARLDAVLLAGALALAVLRDEGGAVRDRVRRGLAVAGPVAAALVAYAAVNLAMFGHAQPVSASAKMLWSRALLDRDPHFQAGGWFWAKAQSALWMARHLDSAWVLGLVVGTVGAAVVSFTPAGKCTRALRPFVAAGALQLAAYVLLHHGELSYARWYYVLQPLLAALVAADLLEWTLARVRARRMAGALACGLAVAVTAAGLWRWRREESRLGSRIPLLEAAAWVAAELPTDARIGSWNAGTLGYLSGRTVVNLDGLVNSWDYLESGQFDLCGYWERTGITHLVDAFAERGPDGTPIVVPVVLPAARDYARCAHRLEHIWQDGPEGLSWRVRAYRLADRR